MIAIVTGASSGIGSEFCRALDSKGLESIWLVARRKERLDELGSELRTPCRILSLDLTDMSDLRFLLNEIDRIGRDVCYLVNCAGYGRFGSTEDTSLEDISGMISLNCTALATITSACIPHMSSGSHIIQVCSASAYLPLMDLNVYASTKAFVRSFSDGLRRELRYSGISVLEVSPGWVETDFLSIAERDRSVPSKVFKHTVTPEQVVAKSMSDLGSKRSVCGAYNRFQIFVCIHLPRIATMVWERSLRR